MSWNKLAIALFVLFMTSAHAQEAKCPSYHEKVPLGYVGVYDGPPKGPAGLMADFSRGTGDHEYGYTIVGNIFDNGHELYLVCIYGEWNSKDTETIKVAKRVERCYYRKHPKGQPLGFSCK
ncbi:MAG: STY0301 family protein [Terracidiphilus sp.]|jgi:hypothetical protein